MEIQIQFGGGPMDGSKALTDALEPTKVFFDSPARKVFVYHRENEVIYVFDSKASDKASAEYEPTALAFMQREVSSLRFLESEGA